jgi:hypothetical protein
MFWLAKNVLEHYKLVEPFEPYEWNPIVFFLNLTNILNFTIVLESYKCFGILEMCSYNFIRILQMFWIPLFFLRMPKFIFLCEKKIQCP